MENKKLQVIICRGLPASGKSSWADDYIKENPNFVVIEKDQIRKNSKLFHNGVYKHKRGDESIVIKERDRLIKESLANGKSVISSDANLVKKHISQISSIARQYEATIGIKSFLGVPLKELIRRDKARENSVGEQVIRSMFHRNVKKMPTFLKYDPRLPTCIISDIDSTLTLGPKNRSPYEWHKVGNDDINLGTSAILDGIKIIGYVDKIFLFSGRDEICRPETEEWLERHDIEYDKLVMRRTNHVDENGNQVKDTVVKQEMLEKYIVGKYNVLFIMDDRKQVCDMWRDVYGLNLFQVGDVNHSF